MVTQNLCPEKGLANGTQGIIRDIIPESNMNPPHAPRAIVIEIPDWQGDSFHPTKPNYVALPPKVMTFLYKKYKI